jgi:hypothetical protein
MFIFVRNEGTVAYVASSSISLKGQSQQSVMAEEMRDDRSDRHSEEHYIG